MIIVRHKISATLIALLVFCAFCRFDTAASAASPSSPATTTFTVSATVAATCTVTATNMAFGAYVPTVASTAQSTITASCSSIVSPSVQLSLGTSATALPRYMSSTATPANHLNYNLYQDSGFTTAWSVGASETVPMTGANNTGQIIVYGQIPAGEYVPAANDYTDTITVTLNY
jgi:spore coat protein U-like protein